MSQNAFLAKISRSQQVTLVKKSTNSRWFPKRQNNRQLTGKKQMYESFAVALDNDT